MKSITKGAIIYEAGSTIKNKTGDWRTFKPVIDINKCVRCGLCWAYCPDAAIIKADDANARQGWKPVVDYDFCKGCGICAKECPVGAIEMVKEEK
ncbi:MAG: pyruvate synthase [Thermoplasmata archaeon]|nr:MAG: pyruvate synthase [Thermoplasmata archaeon]